MVEAWRQLLGIGRVRFSLTELTGGDILVVGGEDASGKHLDSVEIANLEPLATTCTNGNQCASAFCVDGVCCDKACDGACDACNIAGKVGTCSLRPAQAVAENPTCAPYRCDGKSAGCPKECATTTDCVDGAVCNVTTRTCVASSATCDGDHTTTRANGDKIDCAPYKCDSDGFCKSECRSVSDCASPNACDAAGRCVSPTPSAAEGCSTSGDSGMALGIGVSLVAWLVLLARKRARLRSS